MGANTGPTVVGAYRQAACLETLPGEQEQPPHTGQKKQNTHQAILSFKVDHLTISGICGKMHIFNQFPPFIEKVWKGQGGQRLERGLNFEVL